MTSPTQQRIEQVISWLRLPLIMLVVLNHTHLLQVVVDGVSVGFNSPLFRRIYLLFSENFARLAVPLFFLFSGWLFFREGEAFDRGLCLKKLRRRLTTLLLPYLLWNLITLLLTGLGEQLFSSLTSGRHTPLVEQSPVAWIQSLWITPESTYSPACAPLWYVRDLMVTLCFAWPIACLLRRLKGWLPLLLGLLWVFIPYRYTLWYGASLPAFFFFTLGSWCALCGHDFVEFALRRWRYALVLYLAALVPILYYCSKGGLLYPIYNLGILCGMTLVVAFAARGIERGRLHPTPDDAGRSFFLYAAHILPITLLTKAAASLLHPTSMVEFILIYFACPAIVIVALLLLYRLLHRYLPTLCRILTGGR